MSEHAHRNWTILRVTPWRLALIYGVVSIVWVSSTDLLLDWLLGSGALYNRAQEVKGPAFVLMSALGLWWLGRRAVRDAGAIERERHHADERFRRLIENAGDGFYVHDLDGEMVEVNHTMCELLGEPRERIIGRRCSDFDPRWTSEAIRSFWETSDPHSAITDATVPGPEGPIELEVRVSLFGSGEGALVLGLARDVTARRRADEVLRGALQRLAIHRERTPLAVVEWDDEFKVVEWNPGAERVFGYTREEVLGRHLFEQLVPEDQLGRVRETSARLLAGTGGERSTNDNLTKDGRRITCDWYNTSLIDQSGRVIGWASLALDITERVEAVSALAESEARLREMASSIDSVVWLSTPTKDRTIYVSPAYETIWGRSCESLREDPLSFIAGVHPDDHPLVHESIERQRRGLPTNLEYRVVRPDGTVRWVSARTFPVCDDDGRPIRIAGVAEDVTERKRWTNALERLVEGTASATGRAFFDSLVLSLSEALGARDVVVGELIDAGRRVRVLSGCRDGALMEPIEYDLAGTPCAEVLTSGLCHYRTGVAEVFPEDPFLVERQAESYVGTPLVASDGRPLGLLIAAHDAPLDETIRPESVLQVFAARASSELERLLAERLLRESESALRETGERFRQMAESISEVFWLTDWVGKRVLYVSPAYERMYGQTCESLYEDARSWRRILHPDDRERVGALFDAAAADGGFATEYRVVHPDGTVRWIFDRAFPVRDEQGRTYRLAGISEDVTERRRAERHRQFMLRELDHRVKNNLAAVISLAEQSLRSAPDLPSFGEAFVRRVRALDKLHGLLAQTHWEHVRLRDLVDQTVGVFIVEPGRLRVDGADLALPARAAGPLAMALHELATNALKYGALAVPTGSVSVSWRLLEGDASGPDDPRGAEASLEITWQEAGAPTIAPPARRGFGVQLIEGGIAYELHGDVSLEFEPGGVRCRFLIPLPGLKDGPPREPADERGAGLD